LTDALIRDDGGIVKIGYSSEFGVSDKSKEARGNREGKEKGETVEYDEYVSKENPFITRWPMEDFYHDTNVTDLHKGRWIAFRFWRSIQDIIDDPAYDRNMVAQLEAESTNFTSATGKDKQKELYEVWDKKTGTVFVLCLHPLGFMIRPKPWPYDCDGFPVEHLLFFKRRRGMYGMSPMRAWMPTLKAMCDILGNYVAKSRRTVPKTIVFQDAFDAKERKNIESREQSFVFSKLPPTEAVAPFPIPPMPTDERFVVDLFWQILRFVAGVSEQQAGVQAQGDETATSVIARQQFSMSRIGRMRRIFELFWGRILRKVSLVVKQKYPESKMIPILGDDEQPIDWMEWSAEYRNAEFDLIRIDVNSTAPMDEIAQQQMFTQIAQSVPALMLQLTQAQMAFEQLGVEFDSKEMARQFLRVFPQIQGWNRIFPDVYASQDPDWENNVIIHGGTVRVLEGDNHKKHIRLHLRGRQDVEMGGTELQGLAVDAALQGFDAHIMEHQANLAAETPQDPNFGFMTGSPPAPEGMPQTTSTGGRANAMVGQSIQQSPERGPGAATTNLNLAASGMMG
jgi:hypothetical protein